MELQKILLEVPDPRKGHLIRYPLVSLLLIALIATMAGADDFESMEAFAKERQSWLETFLELPQKTPCADTFRRLFRRLNPNALSVLLTRWIKQRVEAKQEREHIAVDGKTLRGSLDKAADIDALHVVQAFATQRNLWLGQLATDGDSNEITAIPKLLGLIDLSNAIVTIDAMGCQREIAQQIIEQGGDYLLTLKGNQPAAHAAVSEFIEDAIENRAAYEKLGRAVAFDETQTTNKGHGRLETRTIWVTEELQWWTDRLKWKGLRSVAQIEYISVGSDGKRKRGVRYFLSSLPADAKLIGRVARDHWRIENNLHWQLDVTFNEDKNRCRRGHESQNLATLRRCSLALIKADKTKGSVNIKRLRAALNPDFLKQLIGL